MSGKINLKILLFSFFLTGIIPFNNRSKTIASFITPVTYSVKDTIININIDENIKPTDSIITHKPNKSKLLSKEGIIIKQYAKNTDNIKLNIKDSSLNQLNNTPFVVNTNNKENSKLSKSLINNAFRNKNLTESPSINLFSQLSDKKSISKLEFLNTIKQINQLKKEIYKKNAEQKKTNPVKWLILLIAAILIIVVLAFFVKEVLTLFLIAFMLVAVVLLIGFL